MFEINSFFFLVVFSCSFIELKCRKKKSAKIGRKERRTKAAKEKAKAKLAENLKAKPDQRTLDHRYSGARNLQRRTLLSTSPQNLQPRTPPISMNFAKFDYMYEYMYFNHLNYQVKIDQCLG